MRVLVTGASGFLGSFTVERLNAVGHEAVALDTRWPSWTPGTPWVQADVTDIHQVRHAFDQLEPEAVIHLAGILGTQETLDHPQATVASNVIGAINVLECCRDRSLRYVGVDTGTPWRSPYAISKRAASEFARGYSESFGLKTTVIKIFNAYGPRQDGTKAVNKIVPRFAVNALKEEPIPIFGSGEQVIDLVHVDDCAEAFVRAVERAPGNGEIIEVASGVPITVLEIAQRVIDIVGSGELTFLPRRLGEGPEYPIADLAACKEILDFVPDASLDRLAETVDWYRVNVVEGEAAQAPASW